jgi:membrane protein implicated in regulation of membrane protease activity
MMFPPFVLWLSLGVVLLIVEVVTGGFWIGFFGVGGLVTALALWTDAIAGLNAQLAVFLLASVLPLAVLRKPLMAWLNRDAQATRINDAAGQIAVVVQDIVPPGVGRVEYQGSTWEAESAAGERLTANTRVQIVRQDGTRLSVRAISG